MTRQYGLDTSVLLRLATGEPPTEFDATVRELTRLVEQDMASLVASSMVVGEAYIALQHHYEVSKPVAKAALKSVLTSGLVSPLGGQAVLDALSANRGCGLLDRLIALDYAAAGRSTLTRDRKMATLPQTRLLA
jgi:predicted nucleic acid-binding protein